MMYDILAVVALIQKLTVLAFHLCILHEAATIEACTIVLLLIIANLTEFLISRSYSIALWAKPSMSSHLSHSVSILEAHDTL